MMRLSEIIASAMGVYIPSERLNDLERSIQKASNDLGFGSSEKCVDELLASGLSASQIEILAPHLTVGETYFFREKKLFDSIENEILPELIAAKRKSNMSIKIWSAGCCTGEEPYTLAMILMDLLPDIENWNIDICATDINKNFLKKAKQGIYGEWSFRETSTHIKNKYFAKTNSNYQITDHIKKMVRFEHLNLVANTAEYKFDFDLIFCRNVLMYFRHKQIAKTIKKFYEALNDKGFLFIGQSEFSVDHFTNFTLINNNGTLYYKKGGLNKDIPLSSWMELDRNDNIDSVISDNFSYATNSDENVTPLVFELEKEIDHSSDEFDSADPDQEEQSGNLNTKKLYDEAIDLYKNGKYKDAVEKLLLTHKEHPDDFETLVLLTRIYADRRMLKETLEWSEKAIEVEKLNPLNYYLQALIQIEFDNYEKSVSLLQRAIYLDQDFVIAHFMLGDSNRKLGNIEFATKHWRNALTLLKKYTPDEIIPHSDGLTVRMLSEIILSIMEERRNR